MLAAMHLHNNLIPAAISAIQEFLCIKYFFANFLRIMHSIIHSVLSSVLRNVLSSVLSSILR